MTSTTIREKPFIPAYKAKETNNIIPSKNDKTKKTNNIVPSDYDLVNVKMIFNYKHKPGNISPGIIICDNKGKDGKYLTFHHPEDEVILFPFTFVRISKIDPDPKKANSFIMYLDIVNRNGYIEYTLKNKVEKRSLVTDLDKNINNIN